MDVRRQVEDCCAKREQRLSVFLVVKNEEATVRRALESMLECADEYVVRIDDTSNDGTEEIVRAFAAEHPERTWLIDRFTWMSDFSLARNAAIERCTGDWVFQLDGHEYLARGCAPVVREYMERMPEHVRLISVAMDLEPMWPDGVPEVWFMQHHMWRNGMGIRYVNASHNAIPLDVCPAENRLRTPDIRIVHDRPHGNAEERRAQRRTMNTPYFAQEVRADRESERGWFYLGMSYADAAVARTEGGGIEHDLKLLKKAVPCFRKYLELFAKERPEEAFEAAAKLGECLALLELWEEARDAFFECVRLQPLRAEGYFNLGQICIRCMELLEGEYCENGKLKDGKPQEEYMTKLFGHYCEAERWLSIAAAMPAPVTSYFLRAPVYVYMPSLKLGELNENVYYFTGREEYFQKAKMAYEAVLERLPGSPGAERALERLKARFHEREMKRLEPVIAAEVSQTGREKSIAVFDSTGQFTGGLIERWSRRFRVRVSKRADYRTAAWADAIFCEWCDGNAIALSQRKWGKPVLTRMWRYEVFSPMLRRVRWENISGLVAPSEMLLRLAGDRIGAECPIHTVYPGVDLEKLDFKERERGTEVAVVALLHARKGLPELAEIVERERDSRFHLAGRVQQPDLWRAFWWRLRRAKEGVGTAADRVIFHGWQEDVNAWLDRIEANFLLSCSWSESFGFNIAEAMAKGIRPVIRRFEGAEELWPKSCLYDSTGEARAQLHCGSYESAKYRRWVAERYDADREADECVRLLFGDEDA